jgi:hypothetical protein
MNSATLRSTLRTSLLARANLSSIGTEVHRYPPGSRATIVPTIFFGDMSFSSEGIALSGPDADATYTLGGEVYAFTTGGATDDDWDDAEINATTLLVELRDTLEADATVGGVCSYAWLSGSAEVQPSQDPDTGRTFFSAEFTITIRQVE